MYKYFIPHKIKVGDITHLADNDSKFAISAGIAEEDFVTLQATNGIFTAQVTFVERASVEVEVIKLEERIDEAGTEVTVIQSVSNISKFSLILEKLTEIGVSTIIPIMSDLTLIEEKRVKKDFNTWNKVITEATEQSRNPNPPILSRLTNLSDLSNKLKDDEVRLCFATENVQPKDLSEIKELKEKNVVLAFGPESGWSLEDIKKFKSMNFTFVRLKGNILRTETSPIVGSTIIKFIKGTL